jgi:hypothetical protein
MAKYAIDILRLSTCWDERPSSFHTERHEFDSFEEAYMEARRASAEAEEEAKHHPRHDVSRKDLLGNPAPKIIEEVYHSFGSERKMGIPHNERYKIEVFIQLKKVGEE